MIEERKTSQGLRYVSFIDINGQQCTLQQSLADEDAAWFGVDLPQGEEAVADLSLDEPDQRDGKSKFFWEQMHLTQSMVQAALPYLKQFVAIGCLDSAIPERGRLIIFFGDKDQRPCILEESSYQRRPTLLEVGSQTVSSIRFGVDLTGRVNAIETWRSADSRRQLEALLADAREQLTGDEERLNFQMHLSQELVEGLLPYLEGFAQTGHVPSRIDFGTPLEQARQLIADSGLAAIYTIDVDLEYGQESYEITVEQIHTLNQMFIPPDALVMAVQRVLDQLLALGPVASEGYEERLASLLAGGHVRLHPQEEERVTE